MEAREHTFPANLISLLCLVLFLVLPPNFFLPPISFSNLFPDESHHDILLGLLKQLSNYLPCTHFCPHPMHSLLNGYSDFLKYKFNFVPLKLLTVQSPYLAKAY